MKLSPWLTIILAGITLWAGCSSESDPDYIGPRATEFRSGVSFSVHLSALSAGPQTISRPSLYELNELVHIQQPPIITNQDVERLTIEEAPGQGTSVTLHFSENGVQRLSDASGTENSKYVVLVDDRIVATFGPSEWPNLSSLRLRESLSVTDLNSMVD